MKKALSLVCVLAVNMSGFAAGLVAHYSFDGTLEDGVGIHDGSLPVGSANYVDSAYNLVKALSLDGSQYVDIGFGQPKGTVMQNGSITLWFNVSSDAGYKMLFGTFDDGVAQGIWSGVRADGLTEFGLRNESGGNISWAYDNSQPVSSNTWYYYAATWKVDSGTGGLNINEYLNAVLVRSGTQTDLGAVTWQYPMLLGAGNSRGNPEDYWPGALDEVKVYDYALDPQEIAQSYNDVVGAIGVVSYYSFNGTLEDRVGYYDGSLPVGNANYISNTFQLGRALSLDGSQYVDIGVGQPKGGVMRNGTISLWFNMSADPGYKMLFGTFDDGVAKGIWAGVRADGLTEFGLRNDSGGNISWTYDNSQPVSSNIWYFYTATWEVDSGTDNLNINEYLNAELIRSGTQTDLGTVSWQHPMALGAGNSQGTPQDFWFGSLDEVKVYDSALNQQEVIQNYIDAARVAVIEVSLTNSMATLSWNSSPNMQYEVWFAETLSNTWQRLETVPPSTDPDITREYLVDSAEPTGFFKIIADMPLLPLDGGSVDIMQENARLWNDRDYFATAEWPTELVGQSFVRSSINTAHVVADKEGYIMVATPTFGQWGGFSDEPALRADGFDRIDTATFLSFKGANSNGHTCCIYQKKVVPGDTYERLYAYGVTLWREDPLPLYTIPSPVAPPVNYAPGPEYGDDVRMFQGIPSLSRAGNGRLWATWYGGGTGEGYLNYIMLATSGDDGTTWSGLKLVIDPDGDGPLRASEPGLWLDPNGKLWLMWNQYPLGLEGPDSSLWAITTSDPASENPTWSTPRLLAYPNMNSYLKPLVMSDGTWLWPSCSFYDPVISKPLLSSDEGASFTAGGEVVTLPEADRNYQEYNVVELSISNLWLTTRASYGMGESFSTDKGMTWTPVTPSSIVHVPARHFMTRLNSGNLLLVKHGLIDEKVAVRSKLMAFISDDEGATWSDGFMLDERDGVSYPDGVEAPDGTIYIIYDYNRHTDKEILMATFTEADVVQGADVSGKVRYQVIVNKATGTAP